METQTIFSRRHTQSRRPRLRRVAVSALPTWRVTPRDGEMIQAVYAYRTLSSKQVEALFFGGSLASAMPVGSRCRYRLQLLYLHRLLARSGQYQLPGEGMRPFVYTLDKAGAKRVAERLGCALADLDWEPPERVSQIYQSHLLATNDVRIAINLAAKKHGYTIPTWLDDKTLRSKQMKDYVTITGPEGQARKVALVPDGYFVLNVGERTAHLFLEMDLGTITGESSVWGRRDIARKIVSFLAYHHSGQFADRYGSRSMRVLFVTTGEKRLATLKAVTERVGGKSRFWFATLARIKERDVLTDPIWAIAGREGLFRMVETA